MMAVKKKESSSDFPRPLDNPNLVGHDAAKSAFLDAWSRRDVRPIHPVWLLSGPRGIGKATLAYDLARRIFSDLTGRAAEDIAEQMSQGGLGDLFIVDLEHSLSPTKTIPVDAVRGMIARMQVSSMGESWRVAVIDSVDELSRDTPNALLKILEEPPSKTIFFLIAHSLDRILPTIRSRSRIEKLRPLSGMELREIAAKLLPGREIGDTLVKISGGSFGRVAGMISLGADALFDDALRIIGDGASNSSDYLALAKRIARSPENMTILLDAIARLGLAELYPSASRDIERMNSVNLEPELAAFKIITGIKKCI
ncbi:MAG: AAA family ATPase [Rickettsiales bacterium]|jgi:DNA polymerase-3 subunit delta'|nr:AAA family ATPase [Rickettsiales bacterium]